MVLEVNNLLSLVTTIHITPMRPNFNAILRGLWKNKVFTLINIGGLSIGLAVAVLILWWVKSELSYDNYHPNSAKVYRVTSHLLEAKWIWETSPLLLSEVAAKEVPEIVQSTRLSAGWNSPAININGKFMVAKTGAYVDKNWFSFFHYNFIRGN